MEVRAVGGARCLVGALGNANRRWKNPGQPSSVYTSGLFFNQQMFGLSGWHRRPVLLPGHRAAKVCKRWSLAGSEHAGLGKSPARTTNPPFMSSARPGEGQHGGEVQKWSTVAAGRDFTDGPLEEVVPMLSLLNFIPDTSAPNGFTALMSDGAPCLNASCRGRCVTALALLTSQQFRGPRVDT